MASSHPEPSNHDRPLAQEITTATRAVHATLNRSIIARLPLALPPRAADPTAYVSGLLHIAPIYIAFESLWRDIAELPLDQLVNHDSADAAATSAGHTPALDHGISHNTQPAPVCPRVQAMLRELYLPDLMRTDRLKEDIRTLSGWPSHVVEEQLEAISQTGRLSEFIGHIKRAVQQKPHILLAYSYIMFMALFAGGRFIRASLESAGDEFWRSTPSLTKLPSLIQRDLESGAPVEPYDDPSSHQHHSDSSAANILHDSPFCFFHFSTPNDGEDLKLEFKSRLSSAERTLTTRERREIVQEAVCIFDNMRLLVQQLDVLCAGSDQEAIDDESMESLSHLLKNPLGSRFRDSLAVTKERAARSSSKWSSSSDDAGTDSPTAPYSMANGESRPLVPNHPFISGGSDFKLCPAMAKSMRFEKTSARTLRLQKSSDDLRMNFAGGVIKSSGGLFGISFTNLVVAFAFGAVFICALLSRGGMLEMPSSSGSNPM